MFIIIYQGGIGKLTDGIIGDAPDTRLVWNKSPVTVQFYFDGYRHFKSIHVYSMINKYRSIQIKIDDSLPIKYKISSASTSLSTIFVYKIQLNQSKTMIIGRQVEILFEFNNESLCVTEITFDNKPILVLNTTPTSITTTNCPLGELLIMNKKQTVIISKKIR